VTHLGILATTSERAALRFPDFRQNGYAEIGLHDHPDVTLEPPGNVLRARVTGWFEHRMFKGQDSVGTDRRRRSR